MYIYTCIYLHIYTYMYVNIYVHICICICRYIYIHTYLYIIFLAPVRNGMEGLSVGAIKALRELAHQRNLKVMVRALHLQRTKRALLADRQLFHCLELHF